MSSHEISPDTPLGDTPGLSSPVEIVATHSQESTSADNGGGVGIENGDSPEPCEDGVQPDGVEFYGSTPLISQVERIFNFGIDPMMAPVRSQADVMHTDHDNRTGEADMPDGRVDIQGQVLHTINNAKDGLTANKLHLSVASEEELLTDGGLGVYDEHILAGPVPSDVRDHILTLVTSCYVASSPIVSTAPTLPSVQMLDRFIRVLLTGHRGEVASFIHIPTFSTSTCDIPFIVACVAAGAAKSPNPIARRFGLSLMEVVRIQLRKLVSDHARLFFFAVAGDRGNRY